MKDNKNAHATDNVDFPKLKVVHSNAGNLKVYFPFTDIPVEMTKKFFDRNITTDQYIIDFEEDFDHTKAG